jgi:cytidine deaminase
VVAEIAHRVVVMQKGRVIETGPRDDVLRHPREPYTQMLVRAVPTLDPPPRAVAIGSVAVVTQDLCKSFKSGGLFQTKREVRAAEGVNSETCVLSSCICAERTAIAKMITDSHEYGIQRIVAVWKDADGAVFVIPPCGYCRQFMADTDSRNIHETVVILSHDVAVPLCDLLPYHDWWQRQP